MEYSKWKGWKVKGEQCTERDREHRSEEGAQPNVTYLLVSIGISQFCCEDKFVWSHACLLSSIFHIASITSSSDLSLTKQSQVQLKIYLVLHLSCKKTQTNTLIRVCLSLVIPVEK